VKRLELLSGAREALDVLQVQLDDVGSTLAVRLAQTPGSALASVVQLRRREHLREAIRQGRFGWRLGGFPWAA
jgi:hypothetical protein